MKSTNKIVTTIKDFRLLLTPRTIIFLKKNPHSFRIYIEKDLQVIGTVKQLVPPLAAHIKYSFSEFNTPIEFRTLTQKKSPYKIALYQLDSSGIQQFVENSQLKFSKFLEEYYEEFLEIEHKLNSELKAKDALPIHQIWRNLIGNFTRRNFNSSVRFQTFDAIFEFIIHPVHRYDEILEEAEILEQKKRERKSKRMEDVYNKTKTISDLIPHQPENVQLRRGHSQNELTLMKPFSFQEKRKETNNPQVKQELKSFTITIPHKIEEEVTEKEIIKGQFKIGIKNQKESQNSPLQDEYNKVEQKINEVNEIPETVSESKKQLSIVIKHQKYLLMAERKPSIKKNDLAKREPNQYSTSSESKTEKTWKQNLILAFALIVCIIFAYFLMHPLPKT